MNNKYLGVDHGDLRFVRVVKGIEGFEGDEKGSLSIKMKNGSLIRNTTHSTINAIVNDHYAGKFSESKFAVVANFMDVAKKNELISMQPADSYFWNKDGGIDIPNAILFAPDNEPLPPSIEANINVIRYKHGENDQHRFKNMSEAIEQHFKNENLPFFSVDGRGWTGRSFDAPGSDLNGKDTAIVSSILGYQVRHGLHSGGAYGDIEESLQNLLSVKMACDPVQSLDDYKKLNQSWMADTHRSIKEDFEINKEWFEQSLDKMPLHHQQFYKDNFQKEMNDFERHLDEKLNHWYDLEDSVNLPNATPPMQPPPLPVQPPPLPVQPPPLPVQPPPHPNTFFDCYKVGYVGVGVSFALAMDKIDLADTAKYLSDSTKLVETEMAKRGVSEIDASLFINNFMKGIDDGSQDHLSKDSELIKCMEQLKFAHNDYSDHLEDHLELIKSNYSKHGDFRDDDKDKIQELSKTLIEPLKESGIEFQEHETKVKDFERSFSSKKSSPGIKELKNEHNDSYDM